MMCHEGRAPPAAAAAEGLPSCTAAGTSVASSMFTRGTRRNSEFQGDIVSPPSLSESFLVTTAEFCTSVVAEQKKKNPPHQEPHQQAVKGDR